MVIISKIRYSKLFSCRCHPYDYLIEVSVKFNQWFMKYFTNMHLLLTLRVKTKDLDNDVQFGMVKVSVEDHAQLLPHQV